MNDDIRLERLLSDGMSDLAPTRAPDRLRSSINAETIRVTPRPRWLALIKEPPMRRSSTVTVGSPTVRAATVLAASILLALVLAGAGIAGSRILASSGELVVDQSDPDAYQSISAAVSDAVEGDTILVRPGRYVESVPVIGKTLTIKGDGDRDSIVVEAARNPFPVEGLEADSDEGIDMWAFVISDSEATISNLTVLGNDSGRTITVTGPGASPVLSDLVVRQLGSLVDNSSVGWRDGASGVLRDSIVEGLIDVTRGTPEIMGNDLRQTCIDIWPDEPLDTHVALHGNTIHGCPNEYGIWIENASATLIGNDLFSEPATNPDGEADSEGRVALIIGGNTTDITVTDNDIHDSNVGLRVEDGAEAVIDTNRFIDNATGLDIASSTASVESNSVAGGGQGILVRAGSPILQGNVIEGTDRGLVVGFQGSPILVENTICANAINLDVNELAEPPEMTDNEICEDASVS